MKNIFYILLLYSCNLFSNDTLEFTSYSYFIKENKIANKEYRLVPVYSVVVDKNYYTQEFLYHNKLCNKVKYHKENNDIYIEYSNQKDSIVHHKQFSLNKMDTTILIESWCYGTSSYYYIVPHPHLIYTYKCVYKKSTTLRLNNKKIPCYVFELYNENAFYGKRILYVRKSDFLLMRDEKYVIINSKYHMLGEEVVAYPELVTHATIYKK